MINGAKAVDLAHKFIGAWCYRGIYEHGKRLAQMEVVIDEEGRYNGWVQKWVSVILNHDDEKTVEKVIKHLKRLGFSGCLAEILDETIIGCDCEQTFICGMIL